MKTTRLAFLLSLAALLLPGCGPDAARNDEPPAEDPIAWAKEAVWYQIFVERFRNGDPSNDPTRESLTGSDPGNPPPESWAVTPWTQQWYKPDAYWEDQEREGFYGNVYSRRYGGDLQGVLDKLGYLDSLGVTALYFNPLNHSPSLHKYDAAVFRHIDAHFGPDPEGDKAIMAQEDPLDPSTWQMTAADRLFLRVVEAAHNRGMRVILDYSWNHSGVNCFAFQDVKAKGADSPYADWYYVESFDDPDTEEDEFAYKGWFNAMTLPEFREDVVGEPHVPGEPMHLIEGNIHSPSLKKHVFNVTARWLDPNGDGDPSDGVDGYRLDVAAEVPMGFWREYRAFVKDLKPSAYLIGEVWWAAWPDKLLDPRPFLKDGFDANMNYRWFRQARRFFGQAGRPYTPSQFASALDSLIEGMHPDTVRYLMNMSASHDSPRLSTSLYNPELLYKYKANPRDTSYRVGKPDAEAETRKRLLLLHQFTYLGAPQIWNGDEAGMWGADDPDCRKPLVWPDMAYEPETYHPLEGEDGRNDPVAFDHELRDYYAGLCELRQASPALTEGGLSYALLDDDRMGFAYSRFHGAQEAVAVFNLSGEEQRFEVATKRDGRFRDWLTGAQATAEGGKMAVTLPPMSGAAYVNF